MNNRQPYLKKLLAVWLSFFIASSSFAQADADSLPQAKCGNAQIGPLSLLALGYVAGVTSLGIIWYKDNLTSQFRFFDDSDEWMGVDKAGHAVTSYYIGSVVHDMVKPVSADPKKAAVWAGSAGFWLMLPIEVLDGFSRNYGFSWADVAANATGSALFVGQQLAFERQVVVPKFSYHFTPYAQYSPNLLGSTWPERLLKDYNGHTYWLSLPCSTFFRPAPPWLCISAGYSADGMLRGTAKHQYADERLPPQYRQPGTRQPQVLFSLDADLRAIPTKNRFLQNTFRVLNVIKVPAPAVMYWPRRGSFDFKPVYF